MDHDVELRFQNLKSHLEQSFGEDLDIHGVLFLIGVNELGQGHKKYSKQEKTDLIHVAICTLLVPYGYYEYKGRDEEGWRRSEQGLGVGGGRRGVNAQHAVRAHSEEDVS